MLKPVMPCSACPSMTSLSGRALIQRIWQGSCCGSMCSCTVISTAGWSPIVPERCPFRPSAPFVQPWSSPNENSPGPCSTRVPSMLSSHQRPDSTTIHCGAGFSCQSPTQPTGWTVTTTVEDCSGCLLFHCGSAPPTPFNSNVEGALLLMADALAVGPEMPIRDRRPLAGLAVACRGTAALGAGGLHEWGCRLACQVSISAARKTPHRVARTRTDRR